MVFCRRHTNRVVRTRATDLTDFWPRLARSPAPISQKELSLRVAAWPKALQGISTTIYGSDHINKLRTRALRSLGWTNKGMHPMLQLSCLSDVRSDPGYWCMWQTVISFRRFADPYPVTKSWITSFCIQRNALIRDHVEFYFRDFTKLHGFGWGKDGFGTTKVLTFTFFIHLCSF